MPSITIKKLAHGLMSTMSDADERRLKSTLITTGRAAACRVGCAIVNQRTGLPKTLCEPVCQDIIKKISAKIRSNINKS